MLPSDSWTTSTGGGSPSLGLASTFWPQPDKIKLAAKAAAAANAITLKCFMASSWPSSWPSSWNDLLPHRQIQLRGSGQVRTHQVQIIQLRAAIVLLRLQEIEQRRSTARIRKRNRISHLTASFK